MCTGDSLHGCFVILLLATASTHGQATSYEMATGTDEDGPHQRYVKTLFDTTCTQYITYT